jgi:L-asparaginase II
LGSEVLFSLFFNSPRLCVSALKKDMNSEILAKVIRGATVESIHRGHLIAVTGANETAFSIGNPEAVTFFRSAAKPFQAIPFITSGAAQKFGYLESEIALACASHSGEKVHTETAQKMLERIGLSEADLKCGAHLPFDETRADEMLRAGDAPTQIHNNCSGKHAAMLAFARHIGADLKTYDSLENPIQQKILRTVADFTGVSSEEIAVGIDGCAAPNFALSLRGMALSFARLVFPPQNLDEETQAAARRVVSAMLNFPELIGGTNRLDTILMRSARGKLISKIGADGVWLGGILPCERWERGLGIALKVEDGDDKRARPAIVVELLRKLGIFDAQTLPEISPLPVKNRRGDLVGRVEADFELAAK